MEAAAVKVAELAKPKQRVRYEYDVPDTVSEEMSSITIQELTADEELMATKRARNDAVRLAYELAKQSLVEINGKPVGLADGSADKAWETMPPKLRNFVIQAYSENHAPSDEETASFRKSRRIKVG